MIPLTLSPLGGLINGSLAAIGRHRLDQKPPSASPPCAAYSSEIRAANGGGRSSSDASAPGASPAAGAAATPRRPSQSSRRSEPEPQREQPADLRRVEERVDVLLVEGLRAFLPGSHFLATDIKDPRVRVSTGEVAPGAEDCVLQAVYIKITVYKSLAR